MKSRINCIHRPLPCFLILMAFLLSAGCGRNPNDSAEAGGDPALPVQDAVHRPALSGKSKVTAAFFGTVCAMYVWDDFTAPDADTRFEAVWKDAKALLTEIEDAVSVSKEGSDIERFNRLPEGGSIEISTHTAEIIKTAKAAFEDTGGLYNPCVFPLVDLWGFSPRFSGLDAGSELPISHTFPPEAEYIAAFAQLADFSAVDLIFRDDGTCVLKKGIPSVTVGGVTYQAQLDLGGIAKGYSADAVTRLMAEHGYLYGYFTCGGSSLSLLKGREEDEGVYDLGIRKPRDGTGTEINYITVPVSECSLSTSGDYDHYRMKDGIRYCHIIDPYTGWPSNTPDENGRQRGIATATVIGEDAAYSDCMSTALCLMQPDEAIDYINTRLADDMVILALFDNLSDACEIITNMSPGQYTIENDFYYLASDSENGQIFYTGSLFQDLF